MEYPIKVNVLGTEYTIEKHSYDDDSELEGLGGYCKCLFPIIVIGDYRTHPDIEISSEDKDTIEEREKRTIRHELLHAFLNESGLIGNTFASSSIPWSQNEEMIDWMAIQFPKIHKVYEEIGCL